MTGVVVTKPGRIRILHSILIPGQQPVNSGLLYLLTYRGEGFWESLAEWQTDRCRFDSGRSFPYDLQCLGSIVQTEI